MMSIGVSRASHGGGVTLLQGKTQAVLHRRHGPLQFNFGQRSDSRAALRRGTGSLTRRDSARLTRRHTEITSFRSLPENEDIIVHLGDVAAVRPT